MSTADDHPPLGRPLIDRLSIQNYRALRDVTLDKLTPLTVLLGPNGSGKSTIFDVFAFLFEALTVGLRPAWDKRNRMAQLRSRGSTGPIRLEIKYRESTHSRLVTYAIAIDEDGGRPVVVEESLRWTIAPKQGRPKEILRFKRGAGSVWDDETSERTEEVLESPDLLAVSALGQLRRYPQVMGLRRFIAGWYLSYISPDRTRATPEAGPQERLSPSGDNLPNVIQYLKEEQPDQLEKIERAMASRVPRFEGVTVADLPDGRILLSVRDRPFDVPVLSRYVSDGTLKLLAYLTVLYDQFPPAIIGIEEPENQLHPRLLRPLADELRSAAARSQVLVTTHSPFFADAVDARELWIVYRGEDGFSRVTRVSDIRAVEAMRDAGGLLGDLWMEGYFGLGDPLSRSAPV